MFVCVCFNFIDVLKKTAMPNFRDLLLFLGLISILGKLCIGTGMVNVIGYLLFEKRMLKLAHWMVHGASAIF